MNTRKSIAKNDGEGFDMHFVGLFGNEGAVSFLNLSEKAKFQANIPTAIGEKYVY